MQGRLRDDAPPGLTLIETMRRAPDGAVALLDLHLDRLGRDCALLDIAPPRDVRALIDALPRPNGEERLRLTVDLAGRARIERAPAPKPSALWRVTISAERLRSDDPWRRIKSSARAPYDRARAALPPGVDEAILLNERGQAAEGSVTNLFLRAGDRLLTPPLSDGCLPGVLRRSLIAAGRAVEASLAPEDLANGEFFCGNALRGLVRGQFA